MLRRVTLVRTDVSEELRTVIIRVTRIDDEGSKFLRNVGSYKCHIPEDAILHGHRHENPKSYIIRDVHEICVDQNYRQETSNQFPSPYESTSFSDAAQGNCWHGEELAAT
jgi:hypothetical protein